MEVHCPICGTSIRDVPDDYPERPFCSARCKLVDLGNWLDEKYRISSPLCLEDGEDDDVTLN
jgi:uncharacterized protein